MHPHSFPWRTATIFVLSAGLTVSGCGDPPATEMDEPLPAMDSGPVEGLDAEFTDATAPDLGADDSGAVDAIAIIDSHPPEIDAALDAMAPTRDAGPPPPDGDSWGRETDALPEYYPAEDVPQSQIDLIARDYGTASAAWGNFGPIEFWIVGTDEMAAAALDRRYCEVRLEKDPDLGADFQRHCLSRDYSFVDYVRDGGAGLNTMRDERSAYSAFIVTFASKFPSPRETDYTVVTYHEYFHVYQHAHIFSRNRVERERRLLRNPWWAEGGAEYMAQALYRRQPGVDARSLREAMSRKMQSKEDRRPGEGIADIPYGERGHIAYDLGAWFVAYLVNLVGEDTFRVGFHDDLNALGFEGAFVEHFGTSSQDMLDAFDTFLDLPLAEQLDILPR